MATNIEIKARANNFQRQKKLAAAMADGPVEVIPQRDVFYHAVQGRIKLRYLEDGTGYLVSYHRSDQTEPGQSNYHIYTTQRPDELNQALSAVPGVRGEVVKTRLLYLVGRTRIHLDQVQNLGEFLELEVVLAKGDDPQEGLREAQILMQGLEIENGDLVELAYIDLLEAQADNRSLR